MRRVTPFQRGVLTGAALAAALCITAITAVAGTALTLAFAEEPDTED